MRLIDADALKAVRFHDLRIRQIVPADCDTNEKVSAYKLGWNDAIDAIVESAPTVDPVKHGEWRYDEALELEWCSECGFGKRKGDKRWYSYCPNCGAKNEVEE